MAQRTELLPDRKLLEDIHDTVVSLRSECSNTDSEGRMLDHASIQRWSGRTRADLVRFASQQEGEAATLRERTNLWEARAATLAEENVLLRGLLDTVLTVSPEGLPALQKQIAERMRP